MYTCACMRVCVCLCVSTHTYMYSVIHYFILCKIPKANYPKCKILLDSQTSA